MSHAPCRFRALCLFISGKTLPVLLLLILAVPLGLAADRPRPKEVAAPDNADETGDVKNSPKDPPKPEEVDLTTDDNLVLRATYFAGMKHENTIPVILVHDLGPKGQSKRVHASGRAGHATAGCRRR